MTKQIAILLTVFNRKECTLRCLQQIQKQKLPVDIVYHVYITDGGSTDGTIEAIHEHFSEVDIHVKDGVFWNRGMYMSWERAAATGYDYYLWLNDDTFLYNNCINELIKTSNEKLDKAIIVGATKATNSSRITYGGRIARKGIALCNNLATKVDFFNGNIVLVPSYVYNVLGNLDYFYTHSKGDFDYGIRAKKAGIEAYQCGSVLGECDLHPRIDKWCDPEIPFRKRWQLMNKPNGMPPRETYHLEKQTSIIKASIHYCTIILRCIFPSIWITLGKAKLNEG